MKIKPVFLPTYIWLVELHVSLLLGAIISIKFKIKIVSFKKCHSFPEITHRRFKFSVGDGRKSPDSIFKGKVLRDF